MTGLERDMFSLTHSRQSDALSLYGASLSNDCYCRAKCASIPNDQALGLLRMLRRKSRGSVSLEFALVSVFFLLPLLLVCWNGMMVFAERYQINTDLHDLYYFAWSNPNNAASTATVNNFLASLNQNAIAPVSLPTGFQPSLSYACLQSDGSTEAANQNNGGSDTCSSGTLETMVNYRLTAQVTLPVPMPGFNGPLTLNVGGSVRIQ